MAKEDFCFTYYDGDAARDMAHMNRLERGAYNDIIISQRKFGRLTQLQLKKILGRDFEECWTSVELVLKHDDEKYFIEWLENSINKKKAHSSFQSLNGKKGGRPPKKNPNESEPKAKLKAGFDLAFQNESEKKPLGNGYGNEDVNEEEDKEGVVENSILFKMWQMFCELNRAYHKDQNRDLPELLKIAQTISGNNTPTSEILPKWKSLVEFIVSDNWYKSYSIKQINNNIQSILLKKENNGSPQSTNQQSNPTGKFVNSQTGFGKL